jgi:hypothetical protein
MAIDVKRPGAAGSAAGNPLRAHKSFSANPSNAFRKFPSGIGLADDNVVFGLGTSTNAGAASFVLTGSISRAMVLRDLIIDVGTVRGRITSIMAAGDALVQGGSLAIATFSPLNPVRPDFDIPVYTGNVTVAVTCDAGYTCDAGFSID